MQWMSMEKIGGNLSATVLTVYLDSLVVDAQSVMTVALEFPSVIDIVLLEGAGSTRYILHNLFIFEEK